MSDQTVARLLRRVRELCELASPRRRIPPNEAVAALRDQGLFAEADELSELVIEVAMAIERGTDEELPTDHASHSGAPHAGGASGGRRKN